MILPNKFLQFNKSIIYISDRVLEIVYKNFYKNSTFELFAIEQLWSKFTKIFKNIEFKNFYFAFLMLIAIGIFKINYNERGDLIEIINK